MEVLEMVLITNKGFHVLKIATEHFGEQSQSANRPSPWAMTPACPILQKRLDHWAGHDLARLLHSAPCPLGRVWRIHLDVGELNFSFGKENRSFSDVIQITSRLSIHELHWYDGMFTRMERLDHWAGHDLARLLHSAPCPLGRVWRIHLDVGELNFSFGKENRSFSDVIQITSRLSIHELHWYDGMFTRMEVVDHVWITRREFHALHGNICTLTELPVGQHHA
uniref:Uncharacterized protein n=1 Tax=Solanum tuberosum TaxID=4113 RepID=M1DBW6_SOLTU